MQSDALIELQGALARQRYAPAQLAILRIGIWNDCVQSVIAAPEFDQDEGA
jgi:hypothetical protein